jgi:predicted porin
LIWLGATAGGAGTSVATTITGEENSFGFTNRASNSIGLLTDRKYGVQVRGIYQINNKNTKQTAATTGGTLDQSGWGLGADYVYNKLILQVAYQNSKQTTAGTAFSITDINQSTIVSGTDIQKFAGAIYDFDRFKVYAQYVDRTITSNLDSGQFLKRNAQQVGVRSFLSPKVEGWASAGNGQYDQYGTLGTVKFTGYQIGSNYWFRKQTNAYAIFGSTQTSGPMTLAGAGSSKNQYGVGFRHTF